MQRGLKGRETRQAGKQGNHACLSYGIYQEIIQVPIGKSGLQVQVAETGQGNQAGRQGIRQAGRQGNQEVRQGNQGWQAGKSGRQAGKSGRQAGKPGRQAGKSGMQAGREIRQAGREIRQAGREIRHAETRWMWCEGLSPDVDITGGPGNCLHAIKSPLPPIHDRRM
jgi:hypothetical protein